jgi:transposase, IS30 family
VESIAKKRKKNSCFDENKRFLLECYLYGRKHFPKITKRVKLAEIFECDRKTIYNEIKRGTVDNIKSSLETVYVYRAEYAQLSADFENTARGTSLKIGRDYVLCEKIKKLIIKEKYSPYAVIQEFKNTSWPSETRICEKTLYNYVNNGIIKDVKKEDLPNKGVKYKEKGSKRRYSKAICALKSIETRPKEVETRATFGHWELDTVKGGAENRSDCLFTMTERKTRKEISVKMPNAEAESTVSFLNHLERKMGSAAFRKVFITMTCDGGSEFLSAEGIEKSCIDGKPRTKLYYAHPYTACERGTNEVHNRILRRFFPKGTDFGLVTNAQVENAVTWMNNYPRKILNGKTPNDASKPFCPL